MDVIELTHKKTDYNIGGVKIDVSVVARDGREWSIHEASRLMFDLEINGVVVQRGAKFQYRGEPVNNLSLLPEQP